MTVLIENGFRYPLSAFPNLARTLTQVITPLADAHAANVANDLRTMASDAPGTPWETLKLFAPRGYKPSRSVELYTSPSQVAIDLVCEWANHGLHANAQWSMYDTSVRADMWTIPGDDADACYVYGRLVSSVPDLHEALIGSPGFEDYSYWKEEEETPEWQARENAWERVDDAAHFEWVYRPSRLELMGEVKDA